MLEYGFITSYSSIDLSNVINNNDTLLGLFIVFARGKLLTRQSFFNTEYMSDKKGTEEPGLTTEEAKELELDEQPKPTRKTSHHPPPMSYNEEPGRHHKRKGKRKMK